MAKLKDKKWRKAGKAGDGVEFVSTVTVDSDGVFYMSVPDYLQPIISSLQEKILGGRANHSEANVRHSHGKFRARADSYSKCCKIIEDGIDEYLHCEVTEELIIAYVFVSTCHYVKDSNDTLFVNGSYCPEDSRWAEEHGAVHGGYGSNAPYVLGFKAAVVTKRIFGRFASSRIEYERVPKNKLGEWGQKLHEFVHVTVKYNESHELPYTEETAKFFYQSMLNLCKLADALTNVLADPKKVLEHTSVPALSAGKEVADD